MQDQSNNALVLVTHVDKFRKYTFWKVKRSKLIRIVAIPMKVGADKALAKIKSL